MTSAVAYCRISKDDQGQALGVERQELLCRTLAAERGLDLVEVLVDNDTSAYRAKVKRPGFDRLVDLLHREEVGAVVTYHSDRLYRRAADLERLVKVIESTRVQVHTVASGNVDLTNASGRMVARMLGAAAQGESERIGERVRMKHDELARDGKPPGGRPPFGYGQGYKINDTEAGAVRLMAERVLQGASLLRLARELDAAGITTREGRPWHHSSVRATLVNPAVAGLRVHRGEIAGPGAWQPILDRTTWESVRALLADPARKRSRPPRKYLLAGMVFTSAGDPMNGRSAPGARSAERRTYSTRVPATQSMVIGADDLEGYVVERVLTALDDVVLPVEDRMVVSDDVAAIEAEQAELARLRGDGKITLAEWMAAREPLQARLAEAQAAAGAMRKPGPNAHLLAKRGAARKAWPTLDLTERREIVQAVVERVVVLPATRGRWTSVEERLDVEQGGGIVWRI